MMTLSLRSPGGFLFGSPKPPRPPPPSAEPAPSPDPDDPAKKNASRGRRAQIAQKSGRLATTGDAPQGTTLG